MKKKFILFVAAFAFIAFLIPGCDLLEECGNCSLVVYNDGVEESRTPPLPYCGDSYQEKLDDTPDCVVNRCTVWECE